MFIIMQELSSKWHAMLATYDYSYKPLAMSTCPVMYERVDLKGNLG